MDAVFATRKIGADAVFASLFFAAGGASVPSATGTSTGSGSGGEATAGSTTSVPSATGTSSGTGSGGEAAAGSGATPASVPPASGTSTGSGSGGEASTSSLIDAHLPPTDPLYLFYVGWPAVSVVYKPKTSPQRFQARAIFDQPGVTLINNELLSTDCTLRYPAVSFPRVRKGDTFIVAGITYAARENAQPMLDGLEHLCPLAKV